MKVKKINLSRGFKYYVNELVNGLTHARYAFVGVKKNRSTPSRPLPTPRPKQG